MNEEMKTLLASLLEQKEELSREKAACDEKLRLLNTQRRDAMGTILRSMVPDTSAQTVDYLRKHVPSFNLPLQYSLLEKIGLYFADFQAGRIEDGVTVEQLRAQLGNHLNYVERNRQPAAWRDPLDAIDAAIERLQVLEIKNNARAIEEIDRRISALKNAIDNGVCQKVSAPLREQMSRAARSHSVRSSSSLLRSNVTQPQTFPRRDEDDLFDYWFWYMLLNNNSELYVEAAAVPSNAAITAGEGEFNGAGASGDFSGPDTASDNGSGSGSDTATSFVEGAITVGAAGAILGASALAADNGNDQSDYSATDSSNNTSNNDSALQEQYDLGAASFS